MLYENSDTFPERPRIYILSEDIQVMYVIVIVCPDRDYNDQIEEEKRR